MAAYVKLATCCYCGAHEVLRLCGEQRRELACGQCGAPLRRMKPIKQREAPDARPQSPPRRAKRDQDLEPDRSERRGPRRATRPSSKRSAERGSAERPAPARPKPRRRKRAQPIGRRLWRALDDLFDEIEDIFD